jgi:hypothetical protein
MSFQAGHAFGYPELDGLNRGAYDGGKLFDAEQGSFPEFGKTRLGFGAFTRFLAFG